MLKLMITDPKTAGKVLALSFKVNCHIIKNFMFNKEYRSNIIKLFK